MNDDWTFELEKLLDQERSRRLRSEARLRRQRRHVIHAVLGLAAAALALLWCMLAKHA
jgi:ABC-type uncharacterized transport system permease subunit